MRRLPIFGVFGNGQYLLQPVFVEDFADLVVKVGQQSSDIVVDAVGPEIYTYIEMVRLIRDTIGSRAKIIRVPPGLALLAGRLIGLAVGDVVITRDEIEGLTSGLLVSDNPPSGKTPLSRWLQRHAETVGTAYASELQRHYGRQTGSTTDRP